MTLVECTDDLSQAVALPGSSDQKAFEAGQGQVNASVPMQFDDFTASSFEISSKLDLDASKNLCAEPFSLLCYQWLLWAVQKTSARRIFLPAGATPTGLYQLIERYKPSSLKGVTFVQIDEVITGRKKGMFRQFFEEHLPSYVDQFEFISLSEGIDQPKKDFVACDIALLGLGVNGHVAFHEPQRKDAFRFDDVNLSGVTIRNLGVEEGARGRTFGVGEFMRTKKVLVMARGSSKAKVVANTLSAVGSLPGSAFLDHPDFTLIGDANALSLVGVEVCPVVNISHGLAKACGR